MADEQRVVEVSREVMAPADAIFELIADPARQPEWDGNENLSQAAPGQRVHGLGTVFTMQLTNGQLRENEVVDFEEGRRIAWLPNVPGEPHPGHRWSWALEPIGPTRTVVTHTYDWTDLTDEWRIARARRTGPEQLQASLDRLAQLAERQ